MSENNPFQVYVVHEFEQNDDYLRVFEYLESRDGFYYHNCSRPQDKPAATGAEAVQEELRNQIKAAEVVICPVRPDSHSRLTNFQLTVAQAFKIPVLGIQSFGGICTPPPSLVEAATQMVDWNERAITDAIRRTARGEDTSTWDVIEFDPDEFS